MIKFFVNCEPSTITAQSGQRVFKNRKTGKSFIGKTKQAESVRTEMMLWFKKWKPKAPIKGPVGLVVDFVFPFPKRTPKYLKARNIIPKDTKPDCDNLMKQVCDAIEMAGYFEVGDQQVYDMRCRKWYGNNAGIGVELDDRIHD